MPIITPTNKQKLPSGVFTR